MFLQRNHTVLNMCRKIFNFPYFPVQPKTSYHKYSNVKKPILNPEGVAVPPNDHTVVTLQPPLFAGMLQPSDFLHEEGDVTFCAAETARNVKKRRR